MTTENRNMKDMLHKERMCFVEREYFADIRARRAERMVTETIEERNDMYKDLTQEQFDELLDWIRRA